MTKPFKVRTLGPAHYLNLFPNDKMRITYKFTQKNLVTIQLHNLPDMRFMALAQDVANNTEVE